MGAPHRRTLRLGPLISSSDDPLHQPERAFSSSVRPEGLRTPVGSSVLRQHHLSRLSSAFWRNVPVIRRVLRVRLLPQFIMGSSNVTADALNRPSQVIGSEWTLHLEVVDQLVHIWPAVIHLFATSLTVRLPVYLSPASDSRAAGTDALLQPWDDLQAYAFPPIAVVRRVLVN